MSLPKILIGSPVRNRARWLPYYLDHLTKLDYPKELIEYCFVVNDSVDESLRILQQFVADRPGQVWTWNLGQNEDDRDDPVYRAQEILAGLALLRNLLLDTAKASGADFLFSVDSDIMVPPDSLKKLVQNDKDICSALIYNDYHVNPEELELGRFPNIMFKDDSGSICHYINYPENQLFEVDVTGAVYLIKRPVFDAVRYGYHDQGEDIAFCEDAQRKGFKLWCDSRIFCQHIMTEEQLRRLEAGEHSG